MNIIEILQNQQNQRFMSDITVFNVEDYITSIMHIPDEVYNKIEKEMKQLIKYRTYKDEGEAWRDFYDDWKYKGAYSWDDALEDLSKMGKEYATVLEKRIKRNPHIPPKQIHEELMKNLLETNMPQMVAIQFMSGFNDTKQMISYIFGQDGYYDQVIQKYGLDYAPMEQYIDEDEPSKTLDDLIDQANNPTYLTKKQLQDAENRKILEKEGLDPDYLNILKSKIIAEINHFQNINTEDSNQEEQKIIAKNLSNIIKDYAEPITEMSNYSKDDIIDALDDIAKLKNVIQDLGYFDIYDLLNKN
jgi:hypothetical protein